MKRALPKIILAIVISLVFLFLGIFEIENMSNTFLKTLWGNLSSISTIIYTLVPLIILLIPTLLFLTNRWALRVEKMTIGGLSVIFDNPAELYRKQVRNYLDTKRTIFKVDCNYDNFNDTLDSYFEIYKFFREEIKILGNVKIKNTKLSKNEESANLYALTNQAMQVLNNFLTKNQSNYRRWYRYIEKSDEQAYYLTPIGELQKKYPYYKDICSDFEEVNTFFVDKIAREFDIDIEKWNIE